MTLSTTISLDALEGGMWASFMVEDMWGDGEAQNWEQVNTDESDVLFIFLSKDLAGILENSDWRATRFGHIGYTYIYIYIE